MRLVLTLVLLLGACRLIDQRTFERAGVTPAATEVARSEALARRTQAPLLTIRPGELDQDWQPGLIAAERAVIGSRPDAVFDILAVVPTDAAPDRIQAATETASADARAVADALQADGIAADHLHLGLRGDAGTPPREVMVMVR